ncbi:hypothetical protein PSAB6_330061 [Paraburkholderia sabiae]|nr:hypothetical protein PSAB6_330061 [Paraburkholderia sabiae]
MLQIAIAGKRFVSRGFFVILQMTRIVSKIKALDDRSMRIGQPDRLVRTDLRRVGNL